jgi:hypothetical protein
MLAADAQHDSTCDQYPQSRATSEQIGDLGRRVEDLLEVVEDQQGWIVRQRGHHAIDQRLRPAFADAERLGDRRDEQVQVANRRQGDEGDGREIKLERASNRNGQTRLAGAAGSGQGHQPDIRPAQ